MEVTKEAANSPSLASNGEG